MLNLTKAVLYAQTRNWTLTSGFNVHLMPGPEASYDVFKQCGWNNDIYDLLTLSIKSVDIPQHTADLVEKILAGEWHISRNEDEIYVVTFTFRDSNAGALYRFFQGLWTATKIKFPKECSFACSIMLKNPKTTGESYDSRVIFWASEMFMTSISQIQLSHENNEIMEFSVEFKTNEPGYIDATEDELKFSNVNDFTNLALQTGKNNGGALSKLTSFGVNYLSNQIDKLVNSVKTEWEAKVQSWDS